MDCVLGAKSWEVPDPRSEVEIGFDWIPPDTREPMPATIRPLQGATRRQARWAPLFVLLFSIGAQAQHVDDPFTPGLRWSRESVGATAWIPGRVQFADADQLVWASSGALGARLEAYSAWGSGAQEPLGGDADFAHGALVWDLASSSEAAALFALVHSPGVGSGPMSVQLARYPAPSASVDSGQQPLWTVSSPAVPCGAARIACDEIGERVCFAAWDSQNKRTHVRWHSADDGSILAATEIAAGDVDQLVMSADGALTLAADGHRVWVWDSSGALIHYEILDNALRVADFDAGGDHLLLAHGPRARLLMRVAGGFLEIGRVDAAPSELAACGALAESGGGWAVAWYHTVTGGARYELYGGMSQVLVAEHSQIGSPRGLQNVPQAASITPDGERVAFATWGAPSAPEVILLGAAQGGLLWSLDLPGSASDVALDRAGRRIVVAHKSTHANEAASDGEVRLYDTGEADLALVEAPRPGGVLTAETLVPGASVAFFLFGSGVDAPQELPFLEGELWVSLHSRLVIRARRPDASGRAQCELELPLGLEGTEVATQVVARIAGGLVASETHLGVRPR